MTVKNIFVANLTDISAVVFECQNPTCGSRVSYNPDNDISILDGCPQCNVQWADPTSFDRSAMKKFVEGLRDVRKLQQTNRVHVRIELPSESKDKQ